MDEAENMSTAPKTAATIGSSLIPVINKLYDILASSGTELSDIPVPQVAVVGSQSSGKSSVLEALVGRDFLPRGCDICTRRPLVLMLENRPPSSDDDRVEWGEFRHLPGRRFYDFSQIRREIQAETEREAGCNKGVSGKQIRLKISSPNVLNMTIIDLPGITKVPVGDQPSDIETRIRRMIMAHISNENCIILAVSPANSDLATSDALQIAKLADPTGSRTVGVITKLDIMDRGTNACNFLLGRVVPLKLGYVGVVNRCQEDINKNCSIQEALAYEEQFFHDHPVYNDVSNHCGIPQLAKKLNQILEQHIRKDLPRLKALLNSRMHVAMKELQTYGDVVESKAEQGATLLRILGRYCDDFSATVDGKSREMSTKELFGGARIHYLFQSMFVKLLEEVDPCEKLADEDIAYALRNSSGLRNVLFVPEVPFEVLVRKQIAQLSDPCHQCLWIVYDELIKISQACESTGLQRFPSLRRHINEVVRKFLDAAAKPAETMIRNLIEMEMDYINSSHPSFIGGSKAVELAVQQMRSPKERLDIEKVPTSEKGQISRTVAARSVVNGVSNQGNHPQPNNERPVLTGGSSSASKWGISSIFGSKASSRGPAATESPEETLHQAEHKASTIQLREPPSILRPLEMSDNEATEITVTKLLVKSYFDIVRKNIQDLVPKAIMHFLVNHTKRNLHNTFIQILYRESLFEELLQEQDGVVARRKQAKELLRVLRQAVKTLNEVESDVEFQHQTTNFGADVSPRLPKFPDVISANGKRSSSHMLSSGKHRARKLLHSEEPPLSFSSNVGLQY
ncbi:dynamin-related protein 3A, non responding to oxylipins 15, ARABIDOPSIS DYNAMIN-LIKE 2 [Hibiscus trionum]|uniref:Dynamin-related protein 3A, non responding to oxylipins 15, ARABIDOPSIS DYNAMIN-LIKE 2 n=1 Tax=Hibiscus trionum TaxID=183268 RepID=A0A9W7LYZ5_HIBTR|nr:dynamin-related protein 3A, non responding to oxylipins 15, ARABIDOPSIS DYNAMIN-LIKE 2 [Hibiscus trionum]